MPTYTDYYGNQVAYQQDDQNPRPGWARPTYFGPSGYLSGSSDNYFNPKNEGRVLGLAKSLYGNYGFSDVQKSNMYASAERAGQQQLQGQTKQMAGDLSQRGFYSAVPFSAASSQLRANYGRNMVEAKSAIDRQSEELASQQRGSVFGVASQAAMADSQAILAQSMQRAGFNQERLMSQLSFEQQKQLMELQKKMSEKDFGDFLGTLFGQGMGVLSSYVGTLGKK